MHELLTSLITVLLAELGDKTQLLALILAARFKKPIPIILGITLATALNHTASSYIGVWIALLLSPQVLRWVIAFSFIGMAVWMCFPDEIEEKELEVIKNLSIFITTLSAFFLAEMGDKTQIATIALAAHYQTPWLVMFGTTIGMLIADIPAVFIGNAFSHLIPIRLTHIISAILFVGLGIASLLY